MIVLKELNPHNYPTDAEIDANLQVLLEKLNKVRAAWAIPMVVTSGLRSQADQARINPNAPKSNHLIGAAADIYDPDNKLKDWVNQNINLIEEIGLWMEDFTSTPTWVHFQIYPPKSGKRFFIP